MKKTHFIYLIGLMALFSMAFAPAPSAKGFTYSSDEGKMQVRFPAAFEVSSTSQDQAETTKITATLDEQTFFAAYTLHQTELENPAELAEIALSTFSETVNGSIEQQSVWKLKKNEGLQARIKLEEQGVQVQYKVIMVGNLQYQLVVFAPDASFDQKAADRFFKSFKVKK